MLSQMMRSVLDYDRAPVVICNLNHEIVYMNPAAEVNYAKYGGNLVGRNLMDCHNEKSQAMIEKIISWFQLREDNNMIYTFHNEKDDKDVYMVALRDEQGQLIGYYEKHESRKAETAQTYDFSKSLV